MQVARLDRSLAQMLVIDVQERLVPHIADAEQVVRQAERMVRAAGVLELPLTVSEQYVKGLGPTVPTLLKAVEEAVGGGAGRVEKMTFSVCGDAACRACLAKHNRPQVLLVGIETHVCVQQTALDLLELNLQPFLLADAVGSRRPFDRAAALDRMRAAGVVVTTVESAIYELLREAGTELFKRMLLIVR